LRDGRRLRMVRQLAGASSRATLKLLHPPRRQGEHGTEAAEDGWQATTCGGSAATVITVVAAVVTAASSCGSAASMPRLAAGAPQLGSAACKMAQGLALQRVQNVLHPHICLQLTCGLLRHMPLHRAAVPCRPAAHRHAVAVAGPQHTHGSEACKGRRQLWWWWWWLWRRPWRWWWLCHSNWWRQCRRTRNGPAKTDGCRRGGLRPHTGKVTGAQRRHA